VGLAAWTRLVGRLLPGVVLLRRYRRAWLRADLHAGLTVGAMLVPQCMAYAELAGMPPEAGFYAVLFALPVYAVVGTSRHLGVGPEPGTAILAATGVGAIAGSDPSRYAALMAALAVIVGAVCLAGAVVRFGFVADALSKPVLVGYISGVGLTLLSSQLEKFTGVPIDADTFFPRVGQFLANLDQIHAGTLAVGVATLAMILVLRWKAPRVPGALVSVAAATTVSALFDLDERGIAVVGEIPAGLPGLAWPDVSADDLVRLLPVALGIALVGYTDNVLTSRSVAARLRYQVDANHELAALGAINVTAGVAQGFPISSSASRTAVPASLGSQTQLVGIVAATFLAGSLLVLRPVLAEIPQPALAAVIIAAAIAIIDIAGFTSLARFSRSELSLAVGAALGVMIFDVLTGVLIAVVLSLLVALGKLARPHDAVLGEGAGLDGWVDADAYAGSTTLEGLLVYRFDAPLFFANVTWFRQRLRRAMDRNPGAERWVVIDFEGIGSVDATAVEGLCELVDELHDEGVVVGTARANDVVVGKLQRGGVIERIGDDNVHATINHAVRAFRNADEPN
jgi:high affinity sulfate transporter 1